MPSWMKNTGMLLPTRSQVPCVVWSLTAKPRTSRAVSADPREPATVEKRTNTRVTAEVSVSTAAVVISANESNSSKRPWAPAPRACTTRSGMRSWSKCMIFSRRWWSSSSVGPRELTRSELSVSSTGVPWAVVMASPSWAQLRPTAASRGLEPTAPDTFAGPVAGAVGSP